MSEPSLMVRPSPLELMREVAQAGIAYRDGKGFIACTWETFTIRMTSLAVELGELVTAIEAHRSERGGLLDVHREFADVALYTVTMLEDLTAPAWTVRERYHGGARPGASAEAIVAPLRKHWDQAIRAWQVNHRRDAFIALELLLSATANAIAPYGVWSLGGWEALHRAALSKLDSMAGRPARHGKRADV